MSALDIDGHVVLTGPMGSGKTTVGRRLAQRLARPFFDSDAQLEAKFGMSARALTETKGVDGLHRAEAEALAAALRNESPSVVAAAASIADRQPLEDVIGGEAFVVLLKGDPWVLASRAEQGSGHRRPVPVEEYGELTRTRAERLDPYVDHVVDVTSVDPDGVVEAVLAALGSTPAEEDGHGRTQRSG